MNRTRQDKSSSAEHLIDLCLALSREKDLTRLLDLIVTKARQLTNAEAGSLYIVETDHLSFEVLQNGPMGLYYTKAEQSAPPMPSVPLKKGGRPNVSNVSSCVALSGLPVHIEDLYAPGQREFSGVKDWDRSSGFRSVSMLALPLIGYKDDVVAVLQLINRKDDKTGEIRAFKQSDIHIMSAIASQAAVAIVKVRLIQDLQALLYSFVKAIAWAVDAKSHVTGEHINRVVGLTMQIAQLVDETRTGPFKDICFGEGRMEELRYAAWMHDVGKIITPAHLIDKATRLERYDDGIGLIGQRFEAVKLSLTVDWLTRDPGHRPADPGLAALLEEVDDAFAFLETCNRRTSPMADQEKRRLDEIRARIYRDSTGTSHPWITEDEYQALQIMRGNLTPEERGKIENHALMTKKILDNIEFPKHLARVPELASSHHEKPDGSGYPKGLKGDEIPIEARIMAIADIYEALTAKDRPYKKSLTPAKAEAILEKMKDRDEIDGRLFDLCREAGIFRQVPVSEPITPTKKR